MKKWLLLLMLTSPTVVRAELITPAFTSGSMQSTTTTTQEITETIETEVFGGAYSRWSGENILHTSTSSGGIVDTDSVFTVHTAGDPFTLEITTRAAGVVETHDIERTIEQTSTTTSLSVFSQ
jgi:hypothetical protein